MRLASPKSVRCMAGNAVLLIGLAACASAEPGRVTARTSDPQPVDAAADNAALVEELSPSLVLTIEVDGDTATLLDAQVLMMRATAPRRSEGEQIVLRALKGGQTVSTVAVPDQKLNVEEGRGIVIQAKRTLAVAIPMPQPIDVVEVAVPGAARASHLDVSKTVSAYCRDYPSSKGCEPGPR